MQELLADDEATEETESLEKPPAVEQPPAGRFYLDEFKEDVIFVTLLNQLEEYRIGNALKNK